MSKMIIDGGSRLSGSLAVHGAKNSALPILAAALVGKGKSIIHNCPGLTDVSATVNILEHLGCKTGRDGHTVTVEPTGAENTDIPEELMREMRSSIIFLGAILNKSGRARVSMPGGCEIGLRPINIHLEAFKKMGVVINEEHGFLNCTIPDGLKAAKIAFDFPSVGATENVMLLAAEAEGTTVIENAAREPEISDLADFLNGCGARISGAGGGTVRIEGVKTLNGAEHTIIPDRITAATYMCAAAVTGGDLTVTGVVPAHMGALVPVFEEAGCDVLIKGHDIRVTAPPRLRRVKTIRTMPYPGFPTDAQAPVMAMLACAEGTSVFVETIFENRYQHVAELTRMGAKIKVEGKVAVVEGVQRLSGANVECTDLRGAASLIIAGLSAHGETQITNLHHLDRGYDDITAVLNSAGAVVKRE